MRKVKIGDTIRIIRMDDQGGKDLQAREYNGQTGMWSISTPSVSCTAPGEDSLSFRKWMSLRLFNNERLIINKTVQTLELHW